MALRASSRGAALCRTLQQRPHEPRREVAPLQADAQTGASSGRPDHPGSSLRFASPALCLNPSNSPQRSSAGDGAGLAVVLAPHTGKKTGTWTLGAPSNDIESLRIRYLEGLTKHLGGNTHATELLDHSWHQCPGDDSGRGVRVRQRLG